MPLERIDRTQVDRALEQIFQIVLNAKKLKKADGFSQLNQNIHITVRCGLIPCHRTKKIERLNTQLLQLNLVRLNQRDHFYLLHQNCSFIIPIGSEKPDHPTANRGSNCATDPEHP